MVGQLQEITLTASWPARDTGCREGPPRRAFAAPDVVGDRGDRPSGVQVALLQQRLIGQLRVLTPPA
jgi:hypothetical protein